MDIFSMHVWINDGWRMNEDKGESMSEKMSPISRLHFPALKKVLRRVTMCDGKERKMRSWNLGKWITQNVKPWKFIKLDFSSKW